MLMIVIVLWLCVVDETGEFRLWDVSIAERSSEPTPAVTLQIFEMHQGEPPLNKFKFLLVPNNLKRSTANYSDIVACSTKLFHFLPEKNTKEFVAPTCCCFNEAASSLCTAVGKSLSKYDITTGKFSNLYTDLTTTDISAMCLDADKQRYLFIGCHSGEILLVNYLTGQVIDRVEAHNREVTSLTSFKRQQNKCCAGFVDGKMKMLEEINGKIRVHNTLDDPFGVNVGIGNLKISSLLRAVVASSIGNAWGIWNDTSFRRIMLIKERSNVNSIEIIKDSLIKGSDDLRKEGVILQPSEMSKPREHLLTVAVAISLCIRVYTVDMLSLRGIISHELLTLEQVYITQMCLLQSPEFSGVNYSISSAHDIVIGNQLVATTDGGQLLVWDANKIGIDSENKFHKKYQTLAKMENAAIHMTMSAHPSPSPPSVHVNPLTHISLSPDGKSPAPTPGAEQVQLNVPGQSVHHTYKHRRDSSPTHMATLATIADTVVRLKTWSHETQQVTHSHESEAEFRKHAAGIDSAFFLTDNSVMHEQNPHTHHGAHGHRHGHGHGHTQQSSGPTHGRHHYRHARDSFVDNVNVVTAHTQHPEYHNYVANPYHDPANNPLQYVEMRELRDSSHHHDSHAHGTHNTHPHTHGHTHGHHPLNHQHAHTPTLLIHNQQHPLAPTHDPKLDHAHGFAPPQYGLAQATHVYTTITHENSLMTGGGSSQMSSQTVSRRPSLDGSLQSTSVHTHGSGHTRPTLDIPGHAHGGAHASQHASQHLPDQPHHPQPHPTGRDITNPFSARPGSPEAQALLTPHGDGSHSPHTPHSGRVGGSPSPTQTQTHPHPHPPVSARGRQHHLVNYQPDPLKAHQLLARPGLGLLKKSIADRCWGAHLDTIISLVPLHEHGCVLTVSLDGFHRIWNMHEQCLGELPLPNITEKMKNPAIKLSVCDYWMFILEKMRVSEEHRKIADNLVTAMHLRNQQMRIPARLTSVNPQQLQQASLLSSTKKSVSIMGAAASSTKAGIGNVGTANTNTNTTTNSSSKQQMMMNTAMMSARSDAGGPGNASVRNTPGKPLDGRQSRLMSLSTFSVADEPGNFMSASNSNVLLNNPNNKDVSLDNSSYVDALQAAHLRSQVLTELNTQPQLTDDAPPIRALTREEKRLEEKNMRMMTQLGMFPSIHDPNNPNATGANNAAGTNAQAGGVGVKSLFTQSIATLPDHNNSVSVGNLVPGTMLNSMSTLDIGKTRPTTTGSMTTSRSGAFISNKPDLPMWASSDEFCARIQGNLNAAPACFSDQSLSFSRNDGYINGEEFKILRGVADQPEKVGVYDRTEPVLFLRNPRLATSFEIPVLEQVDKSEISFGPQKGLYKNASKYIDDKDRQNKGALLHSLSIARINRDVGKVKSMIHVLPGKVHDDVVIPKVKSGYFNFDVFAENAINWTVMYAFPCNRTMMTKRKMTNFGPRSKRCD
jgi:hypothetical protein